TALGFACGGYLAFAAGFDVVQQRLLHDRGEPGDGWILEDGANRQLDLQVVAEARDQSEGEERVSSRLEKIVVNSEFGDFKHLAPHLSHRFFREGGGGDAFLGRGYRRFRCVGGGSRKCVAVKFAV